VDTANAANGRDTMRCPGFALSGGQAHPIERRGDMLVGPTASHAAHHRQCIIGCRTTVLPGSGLSNAQLRVLATPPVDRKDDVAHRIIDINDDVGNQCPQQLLTGTHSHIWSIPGCRQVFRHVGKSAWIDLDAR
jgi:hypothetical protein